MSLITITRAINASVNRSVAVSEMKHEARIADVKLNLAAAALTRMDTHARKLTEARVAHSTWLASQSADVQQCYDQSVSDLKAALEPAKD